MGDKGGMMPPSAADIERRAQQVIEALPEPFLGHLAGVRLVVEDFPDSDVEAELGLESPWDVLGLYTGHGVGSAAADQTGALPPVIHLYRRPLLSAWAEGEDSLQSWVRHVLIHEIGHHFGLSDAEIEAIEQAEAD
jgi:predicted Zn-dependent protease with MMP-like domain